MFFKRLNKHEVVEHIKVRTLKNNLKREDMLTPKDFSKNLSEKLKLQRAQRFLNTSLRPYTSVAYSEIDYRLIFRIVGYES